MTDFHPGTAYPELYDSLLVEKAQETRCQFQVFFDGPLHVVPSAVSHYRMRAEFRFWHEGDNSYYAMYAPGRYKQPIEITDFSIGSEKIYTLMPQLLAQIKINPILRTKLYQVEFLTALSGDALITLIYHKPLEVDWQAAAASLEEHLATPIIGRSKKQKVVLSRDYVEEVLPLNAGNLRYRQYETGFTQPNANVCCEMINWAYDHAKTMEGDLLELYCGNGNFTIPLAKQFRRVLATEVSKLSTKAALENMTLNDANNIDIVRLSAEEVSEAMLGTREFRRLAHIDLADFNFSTIFLDPPRSGLDKATEALASRFDNIIYVSCNPDTLKENLEHLSVSHEIVDFALFDQFPYTHHRECGVILRRKSSNDNAL